MVGSRRWKVTRSKPTCPSRNLSKGDSSYRENQKLFFSDRPRLARAILDHVGEGRGWQGSDSKEVERYFKSKWGSSERFNGLGRFDAEEGCSNVMLAHPVSAAQVLAARKGIKNGSATGPDGIRKACLFRLDLLGVKLARMFTGFLLASRVPVALKLNRTTLIPKTRDKSTWKDVASLMPGPLNYNMRGFSVFHKYSVNL